MAQRKLIQVYLNSAQKKGLENLTKEKGTTVSHEIRRAVDVYLSGMTPEELELLDAFSREAEQGMQDMADRLDETNRKLDDVFEEMTRIRHTL